MGNIVLHYCLLISEKELLLPHSQSNTTVYSLLVNCTGESGAHSKDFHANNDIHCERHRGISLYQH